MPRKPKPPDLQAALDEALRESFPASDPIAVHATVEDQPKPRRKTKPKTRGKKPRR